MALKSLVQSPRSQSMHCRGSARRSRARRVRASRARQPPERIRHCTHAFQMMHLPLKQTDRVDLHTLYLNGTRLDLGEVEHVADDR